MEKIIFRIYRIFPDILLWTRLPALTGWAGLSSGIWISASFLPCVPSLSMAAYLTGVIASVILIFVSIIISNNAVRFILFGIAGIVVFQLRVIGYSTELNSLSRLPDKNLTVYGTVVSTPSLINNQFRFQLITDSVVTDSTVVIWKYRLICHGPLAPIYGSHIALKGSIACPTRTRLPYIFNDFDYQHSIGTHGRLLFDAFDIVQSEASGFYALNKQFRSHVLEVIENFKKTDHRAILRAAFLGENSFLSDELKSGFRKSGIIHLLAISGLHAGMLIAATYFLMHFLPINNSIKHGIVLIVLWTYQLLIGWLPSLMRATLMTTIVIGALFFQKKRYALQSIGIAGIALLIISPGMLFNPGYQLSFGATAGIMILYPRCALFKPSPSPALFSKFIDFVLSSFLVSLCGFLSTAPILVYHFGTLSFFGLIANIAAVVIMTSAMWTFFLSLLLQQFFSFAVFPLCMAVAAHFDLLVSIANLSNHIPFSELALPAPGPAMIFLYVFCLLALGVIEKKLFKRSLLLVLPAGMLIMSILAFVRYSRNTVSIIRIATVTSAHTAIRIPSGAVWIITDPATRTRFPNDIFDRWMKQFSRSHIERVIQFNGDSVNHGKNRNLRLHHDSAIQNTLQYVEIAHPIDTVITLQTLFGTHDCILSFENVSTEELRLRIRAGKCDYFLSFNSVFPEHTTINTAHISWNRCKEMKYQ